MSEQFADWADRVEYWDVDDLDCAKPEVALPYLEEKVLDAGSPPAECSVIVASPDMKQHGPWQVVVEMSLEEAVQCVMTSKITHAPSCLVIRKAVRSIS